MVRTAAVKLLSGGACLGRRVEDAGCSVDIFHVVNNSSHFSCKLIAPLPSLPIPSNFTQAFKDTSAIRYAGGIGWANAGGSSEVKSTLVQIVLILPSIVRTHSHSGNGRSDLPPSPQTPRRPSRRQARSCTRAASAGRTQRGRFEVSSASAQIMLIFYVAHKLILICECAAWTLPTFQAASS